VVSRPGNQNLAPRLEEMTPTAPDRSHDREGVSKGLGAAKGAQDTAASASHWRPASESPAVWFHVGAESQPAAISGNYCVTLPWGAPTARNSGVCRRRMANSG
jgi:hypothetical protein